MAGGALQGPGKAGAVIASLRGQLKAVRDDSVIIDVGVVSYHDYVTSPTLSDLGDIGQVVELHTHLHVRENDIAVYGFQSLAEIDLFVMLIGVSGIGPRTALATLSAFSPETLRDALVQGDAPALTRIPGIGPKTAQRLVFDLKDKVAAATGVSAAAGISAEDVDVIDALTSLGYSVVEAQAALRAIPKDLQGLDERILAALQSLGSG